MYRSTKEVPGTTRGGARIECNQQLPGLGLCNDLRCTQRATPNNSHSSEEPVDRPIGFTITCIDM